MGKKRKLFFLKTELVATAYFILGNNLPLYLHPCVACNDTKLTYFKKLYDKTFCFTRDEFQDDAQPNFAIKKPQVST